MEKFDLILDMCRFHSVGLHIRTWNHHYFRFKTHYFQNRKCRMNEIYSICFEHIENGSYKFSEFSHFLIELNEISYWRSQVIWQNRKFSWKWHVSEKSFSLKKKNKLQSRFLMKKMNFSCNSHKAFTKSNHLVYFLKKARPKLRLRKFAIFSVRRFPTFSWKWHVSEKSLAFHVNSSNKLNFCNKQLLYL